VGWWGEDKDDVGYDAGVEGVGFNVFFWWGEKTGFFVCGEGAFVIWVEEIADDEHYEGFVSVEEKENAWFKSSRGLICGEGRSTNWNRRVPIV
jgi:hypothetical protein